MTKRFSNLSSRGAHVSVDLLSAYIDRQTTAAERARVEEHLHACATCRAELDSLRQTVALLHAIPRVSLPRAFTLSEAQVGLLRPSPRPAWFGGLLRGLTAVAALAVIAVVTTTLLERRAPGPSQTLARVTSTAAPAAPEVQSLPLPAAAPRPTTADQAPPAAAAAEKPVAEVAAPTSAPTRNPAPTAEKALAGVRAAASPAPTVTAKRKASEPTSRPATSEPQPASQPTASAPAPTSPLSAGAAAFAPETSSPGPDAALARGMGGESGAAASQSSAAESLAAALPPGAGIAYADGHGLWAIDGESGARQLVQADGITSAVVSPDRAWIAYRVRKSEDVELWAVRWSGQDARLLLSESDLSKETLPEGYSGRRIQDVRWASDSAGLVLETVAQPTSAGTPTLMEEWRVDLETGAREIVAENESEDRPVIAPDGKTPWAAIPDATPDEAGLPNGLSLYRIAARGQMQLIGHIPAYEAFWSPDGKRLAYTRVVSTTLESGELFLARADGAGPQLYAVVSRGVFMGWSPGGTHFLYQDGEQIVLGEPGKAPQRLGSTASIIDPHWLGPEQIVYLQDQGSNWMLSTRTVDGQVLSLWPIPREATYNVVAP